MVSESDYKPVNKSCIERHDVTNARELYAVHGGTQTWIPDSFNASDTLSFRIEPSASRGTRRRAVYMVTECPRVISRANGVTVAGVRGMGYRALSRSRDQHVIISWL